MQLKAGDRVYCKKSWTLQTPYRKFINNTYYEIADRFVNKQGGYIIHLYDTNGRRSALTECEVKEFFHTEKELRKLKLNNINKR